MAGTTLPRKETNSRYVQLFERKPNVRYTDSAGLPVPNNVTWQVERWGETLSTAEARSAVIQNSVLLQAVPLQNRKTY